MDSKQAVEIKMTASEAVEALRTWIPVDEIAQSECNKIAALIQRQSDQLTESGKLIERQERMIRGGV